MLKQFDELPESAKQLFEEARKTGNRKEQTRIVNSIMRKRGKQYEIDLAAPIFTELRDKFERRWAGERDKGVVKAVAIVKCGGAAQLQQAIDEGDVMVMKNEDDNRTYYVFRDVETGRQTGTTSNKQLSTKSVVSHDSAKKLVDMLDSLRWNFVYTAKEQKVCRPLVLAGSVQCQAQRTIMLMFLLV